MYQDDILSNENNYQWSGWTYALEFTNRRMEGQLTAFYTTINKNHLTFYKDKEVKLFYFLEITTDNLISNPYA